MKTILKFPAALAVCALLFSAGCASNKKTTDTGKKQVSTTTAGQVGTKTSETGTREAMLGEQTPGDGGVIQEGVSTTDQKIRKGKRTSKKDCDK